MMRKTRKISLIIGLLVWGVSSLFLNDWNSRAFGLQMATVVGLVKNKSFALVNQVYPGFNLVEGDETFRYKGGVYPMKQPGQTILGALIYYPLDKLGIKASNHYDYAVHLITMMTSSLMLACLAIWLYWASYKLTRNQLASILTGVVGGVGNIWLVYSGVMHHDIYAGWLIFGGIALLVGGNQSKWQVFWSGWLMGLSLLFSMLPLTIPIAIMIIVWTERKNLNWKSFGLGVLVGLIPALSFNKLVFDGWFLFANLAGRVNDTLPLPSITNFMNHFKFFLISRHSILAYSPVVVFGWLGASYIKSNHLLKKIIIFVPLVLLSHISTQETFGGYQYGPRYLLPVIPIILLGLPFFWINCKSKWVKIIFKLSLVYSSLVAVIGAMTTAMYPLSSQFGAIQQGMKILSGELPKYRMWPIAVLMLVSAIALLWRWFPQTLLSSWERSVQNRES